MMGLRLPATGSPRPRTTRPTHRPAPAAGPASSSGKWPDHTSTLEACGRCADLPRPGERYPLGDQPNAREDDDHGTGAKDTQPSRTWNGMLNARQLPACESSTEKLRQCLAATQQHRRSTHRKGTVRRIRGSARRGAYHDGQGGRRGTERACLPGRPAWREPGRGATCRAGRGAVPVVSGETDSARRGGCRMAGGPDVARHAAAAACDGKGIRVNGQYRPG